MCIYVLSVFGLDHSIAVWLLSERKHSLCIAQIISVYLPIFNDNPPISKKEFPLTPFPPKKEIIAEKMKILSLSLYPPKNRCMRSVERRTWLQIRTDAKSVEMLSRRFQESSQETSSPSLQLATRQEFITPTLFFCTKI